MLLLKKILSTAIVAACFGLGQAGCTRDDDPAPSGRRNVTMQLTVNAQAVGETDGTPTAGESALHSLRVYAFVKGQPAGYYGVEGRPDRPGHVPHGPEDVLRNDADGRFLRRGQ